MARNSLPDDPSSYGEQAPRAIAPPPRTRSRRRTILLASALVLVLGAGAGVAVRTDLLPFNGSCDGDSVTVRVAASPDIAPALRGVAERARENGTTSDGHCLDVRVSARTGAEVADTLRQKGAPPYEVWLPDSALWVERADATGTAPSLKTLGPVASSPVALAAVPSAAKSLNWPKKQYTWAEIAASATDDGGLRLGSADPARSSTGLLALTRIQASAAKQSEDDADEETAGAARQLAERTAPGDSQVLATLPRDDSGAELGNPKRNEALLLSEQAAHQHNTGDGDAPDLRLLYPKDGVALLDYPYTLVNDTELSTRKARAAVRFQTLLDGDEGQSALRKRGFRPEDGQASGDIVRQAGGRTPQPYGASPGKPPSPKSVETALGMWTITVQSARFTIAVDASASMSAPVPGRSGQSRMDVTKSSLIQGLSQFTPEDEVGLWEFSHRLDGERDHRELVPTERLGLRADDGSTHRDRLTSAFGKMQPISGGATGLYDTTLAAYQQAVEDYSRDKFNTLVLVTDGANEDPGSVSRKELLKKLDGLRDDDRPIPLITIAVGPDADKAACKEIAKATGGSAHQVNDPSQIHSVILKAIMAAGSVR